MEEQSTAAAEKTAKGQSSSTSSPKQSQPEHREAYGTAKTENLRDSGLWRFLLPAAIVVFGLALFVIPLIILGPLSYTSWIALQRGDTQEGGLLWVWITMIVLVVGTAATVAWGLGRTFLTQAVNYEKR